MMARFDSDKKGKNLTTNHTDHTNVKTQKSTAQG